MSFYDRYEACCKRANMDPVSESTAKLLGCSRALVSTWKKKSTTPNGETVANAARMLDESADYLLGIIEEPHPIKVESKLTANEGQVLLMLRELNAEGQEAAIAMLSGLMAQDIYKKYPADAMDQKKQA